MRRGYIKNTKSEKKNKVIDNKKYKKMQKDHKKSKFKIFIWLIICIFVYYQVYVLTLYTLGKRDKNKMWLYNGVNKIVTSIAPQVPKETEEKYTLNLVALGDIYTSYNILKGAKNDGEYDFTSSFLQTKEVLSKYDVVIASLNTPVAGYKVGYSTSRVYNSPDELLDTIKSLGISVLATAGNNVMDKGLTGIESTTIKLKNNDLNQIGLNISEDRLKPYVIDQNNIKVGILSYILESEINISESEEYLINTFTEENLQEDMDYLKEQKVDYVICYLNMPNEDATLVNSKQKSNADMLFENGVDIVLGTGSKVVQSELEDIFELSDGTSNHIYAIYSLGDFLGDMNTDERKISVGADISFIKNITKDKDGNIIEDKTKKDMEVNDPLSFYTVVSNKYTATNYPIDETLQLYNNNEIELDSDDYDDIKEASEKLEELLN